LAVTPYSEARVIFSVADKEFVFGLRSGGGLYSDDDVESPPKEVDGDDANGRALVYVEG
jgi:hypothetical protein